ncbi:MAG TPA: putative transporter [Candidatus Methylacidiphilales bacterium]|nr:putative transporter [Candidatus Methylacidiphilales bacterium]
MIICLTAVIGLGVGELRVGGIHLGIAGALFAGIGVASFAREFGIVADPQVLGLLREFGLILFVYTVGIQVGPGFFNSLRKQGLSLNLLSAAIVITGALCAILLSLLLKVDMAAMAGIFSGATTNTPSLGAAQEAIKSLSPLKTGLTSEVAALGYAVAYPFGIVGILLTMIGIRSFFKVDLSAESAVLKGSEDEVKNAVDHITLNVQNPLLNGLAISQLPALQQMGVVISRIRKKGTTVVNPATGTTLLECGDMVVAVGKRSDLAEAKLMLGGESAEDLVHAPGEVTIRRLIVTEKHVLGMTLGELALNQQFGVTVTRVVRAEIVLPATQNLYLQFGDTLQVVGKEKDIESAAKEVGNSVTALSSTNFITVFIGIGLGVAIGSYPLQLPGMPAAVKLGLAGGPLLAAILLSWVGRVGPLVWYMPATANSALRELGIVLFLSCVGLKAGDKFFALLSNGEGLIWMLAGAVITLVPLLLVGLLARMWLKMNYMHVCGLLAGSMTDPPALAFAGTLTGSNAPSVAYATVYPLTMMLRILCAQLLVLIFCS